MGALTVLAPVLVPRAAAAYPQETVWVGTDINWCLSRDVPWHFDFSWDGREAEKAVVRTAFSSWNNPRDDDGYPLATVRETPSGGITVGLRHLSSDTNGEVSCSGRYLYIDYDVLNMLDKALGATARHEMGHWLGLHHTGSEDSQNGDNAPSMVACVQPGEFRSVNAISQDDAASLTWMHATFPYRQLNANFGFEQGFSYWGYSAGPVEALQSGGDTGPGRIRHKTVTPATYIYQTVHLATGNDNSQYRAVANYKVFHPSYDGFVMGTLYRMQLDYAGDNGCAYADGLQNLNTPILVSEGYVAMVSTGHWQTEGTTTWVMATSPWFDPQNADGYRMQYRVHSHADDSTGDNMWVYLDNVRAEGTDG